MLKIEQYWTEGPPTLDDIEEAYKIVEDNNVVVEINWFVPYSGRYTRTIRPSTVKETSAEKYFSDIVPHVYGV